MSIPKLTLTAVLSFCLAGAAFAQGTKVTTVEKVLSANPEPDGKAYRVDLQLSAGKKVSYRISPEEATKIGDGLSKPAEPGGKEKKVATLVYGMSVEIDSQGRALILNPRGRTGAIESLAIPLTGAELLVVALQTKIAEAKAAKAPQAKPAKPQ
jgi:hypothetical protein